MPHDSVFRLSADPEQARKNAQRLFAATLTLLRARLPASADIRHIGATAVPGCQTKGDLDIVVRVREEDFAGADASLAALFDRNEGSVRTDTFSAFEDGTTSPHLGIQLTVIGGPSDDFHLFVETLAKSARLVDEYNELKRSFDGHAMDDYRKAKDRFVEVVLARFDPE